MSDKNEREEAGKNGINTREENLAEHVEGRIEDKLDLDEDTFTEEELNDYLAGLKKENEEKGREQKDLAQGTKDANEVADEDKAKSAIPVAPEDPISLGFYITLNPSESQKKANEEMSRDLAVAGEYIKDWFVNGTMFYVNAVKDGYEFITESGETLMFDQELYNNLSQEEKELFNQMTDSLYGKLDSSWNEERWKEEDIIPPSPDKDYTYNPLEDGEYIPLGEEGGIIIPPQEDVKPEAWQEEFPVDDIQGVELVTADWSKLKEGISDGKFAEPEIEEKYKDYISKKEKAGEEPRTREEWSNAVENWQKNVVKGKEFADEKFNEFKENTIGAQKEITIVTQDEYGNKVKVRVDAIGYDKETGKVVIEEYKSSGTAPLTENQKEGYPLIEKYGGVIVGEGKGEFTGGVKIEKGTIIKEVRKEEVNDE